MKRRTEEAMTGFAVVWALLLKITLGVLIVRAIIRHEWDEAQVWVLLGIGLMLEERFTS